ncbi:Phosphatidylinositol-4:5-bisphosphate 3-kinase catalytic subunit alpha-like isoform [Leptotrombidium deliense]|uniref:Phosphatidylinositol 4,5-bisphosphate 3-kinase catalytic subunit alpha isoform n=1 Tax=Leptotrombidium deliense TaxID=299467 RepID=A0A443SMW0_9ACAR|nr:Phosphatidylinositol-4:5-bisphosphate 3-kinase catalytic subunit alpha-like isoform [Leptotrombidium deliense]
MAPRPTSDELWGHHLMPQLLALDVLMPNGTLIQVNSHRESTIETIKYDVWSEARNHVLYRLLKPPTTYIFVAVTQDAKREEFYDETRRLCDLRLFQPILKLVEPKGVTCEEKFNSDIRSAIGKEIDSCKEPEVTEFRRNILSLCKTVVEERESFSNEEKLLYVYQPELVEECNSEQQSVSNEGKMSNKTIFHIWVKWPREENERDKEYQRQKRGEQKKSRINFDLEVGEDFKASDIIKKAFKYLRETENDCDYLQSEDNYVLKVRGFQQYLLGDYPMYKYKYVKNCLSHGKRPQLMLFKKDELYGSLPEAEFMIPSFLRRLPQQPTKAQQMESMNQAILNQQLLSLWKVDTMFRVKILWATYVNVTDVEKIYVRCGIYHGPESLCPPKDTQQVTASNPKWDTWLDFDLYVPDIPSSARLCLSICSVSFRKKREEHCALAWGNLMLFDYKHNLLSDRVSIYLWPVPKGHDELLNPLGMIVSNDNKDSPCLEVEFDKFACPVVFPPKEQIDEYAKFVLKQEESGRSSGNKDFQKSRQKTSVVSQSDIELLNEIIKRDPLSEMSLQEKDLLWRLRDHCLKIADSLPKLLDAIKWNSRDEVCQLYKLLEKWPIVRPQIALELLDCKFADLRVRNFAVKCLDEKLSDDLLSQYLLQLVQIVKYEPYLDNDLSHFLIRRALMNRRIGHYFFWHLKAEMHDPVCSLRCALLLEAYCRGIGGKVLGSTLKQAQALEKLTNLTNTLKERKDDTQKERLRFLCNQVKKSDFLEALQCIPNPLNHSVILGNLIVEECRIMDSAKRPLWLVWTNPDDFDDSLSNSNAIIFKNGDDLRQDMLTLQVIRIIDLIWRSENLDLKMLPYTCLSTGKHVGMIEVVMKAKTVMNIQRTGGRMAAFQVDCTQLHKWIKDKNKDNYDRAVDTFTRSCAGYCVATFVLGIGDRNPDNIMINEEGQIFHIDFGHFLGHFKKKFGINRERVPFVLTDDFLYVISKGHENPQKSKEFEDFTKLCGEAYLCLRKHANLLITLFTMMLSTGIPELQSIDDIGYLRKTLQVEKSEEEAIKYFNSQFYEAYGGAWTTKIDWFFHSVKHM